MIVVQLEFTPGWLVMSTVEPVTVHSYVLFYLYTCENSDEENCEFSFSISEYTSPPMTWNGQEVIEHFEGKAGVIALFPLPRSIFFYNTLRYFNPRPIFAEKNRYIIRNWRSNNRDFIMLYRTVHSYTIILFEQIFESMILPRKILT